MTANAICINCNNAISGRYCSNCGQKTHVGRLTLHELFHEVWHALTHTDKGILKLIKDLAIHPRQVYAGYLLGQRKKYFSPVLFFLVTAGVAAFIYPYIFEYQDKLYHTNNEFGRIMYHLTKYRALILLPFEVVVVWLLFNKRFNIAEVTVFWLFCLGFTFVLRIVAVPFYYPLIGYKDLLDSVLTVLVYLTIFWHLSIVFGNRRIWMIILLFALTNVFFLADGLLQAYLLFGKDLSPKGDFNFIEFVRRVYLG